MLSLVAKLLIRPAARNKALLRGVKEVVKALRKSSDSPSAAPNAPPQALIILAADISPMDVISHIPVLCEDKNVPYAYIPSRAELGAAGGTKRPTSVAMILPKKGKAADEKEGEDWGEQYQDLAKVIQKAAESVKV